MTQRDLTEGESVILNLIQVHYGPLNTREEVAIYSSNEVVIWVKDAEGSTVLMVNLTSLAEWLGDGTIASEAELLREWLNVDNQ
jgi:hypothetical protein